MRDVPCVGAFGDVVCPACWMEAQAADGFIAAFVPVTTADGWKTTCHGAWPAMVPKVTAGTSLGAALALVACSQMYERAKRRGASARL